MVTDCLKMIAKVCMIDSIGLCLVVIFELYCIVLYCITLHCIALYCTLPHHIILKIDFPFIFLYLQACTVRTYWIRIDGL
jgi:hypothetical protein